MSERTHDPTPRRLRRSRERGEAPSGRELSGAAALGAGLLAAGAVLPGGAADLAALLRRALELRGAGPDGALAPAAALVEAGGLALRLALVPALAAGGAAALAGALQAGFLWSPAAALPRADRLDLARGLRRLASPSALAQAGLGLAKALLLAGIAWTSLRTLAPALAALPAAAPAALLRAPGLLLPLAGRLAAALLVLGALDALLARRRHLAQLRMTRDEVRRDGREDEGDPRLREERRRLARAAAEEPAGTPGQATARATVLVVNPTHLAVALRHDRGADEAPRVLAKGAGREAARLRSAARRAGVPIVRDVPLARALFHLSEVGEEIPEALYDAAAAVLAHLYAAAPPGAEEATP
ncbi:MAG: EscU/YscU/HrcU family type III secretion system export apparatus switch protein [Anaeromyxobacteraceae bacterium]